MDPKFFSLPNLDTDRVEVISDPWNIQVDPQVLALSKDEYKLRWRNPSTRHWLLSLAEGRDETSCVSAANPAALLYGMFCDYDGVFTPDLIEAAHEKPVGKYLPAWWCLSHSNRLHLVWLFSRPVKVIGNAHANALLHVVAAKIRAVKWGVGYDTDSELVTQVMDIGREWHPFAPEARIPAEDIVNWDYDLFKSGAKRFTDDVVSIPFEKVAEEVGKRKWPHRPPTDFKPGTRCIRFWDPAADNPTAAQIVPDGIRVYTPHDNGFMSWRKLLGKDFCDSFTAVSRAPFIEDTFYCPTKDQYWRFFRKDNPPHFEPRTEKVLRREIVKELRLSTKGSKNGDELSQVDDLLYGISRDNHISWAAPVLYRPIGRIQTDEGDFVLNTSLVTVAKPAPRLCPDLTPEDVKEAGSYVDAAYKADPTICKWDNPFAVAKFPHIHRFLTSVFIQNEHTRVLWERRGYPVNKAEGALLQNHQLIRLISWMSHAYKNAARMAGHPSRGQALFIAGKPGRGKGFLGRQLLPMLMGGGVDAGGYYLDGTRFNAGIVDKPIHYIDDKLGSTSRSKRIAFTELLKITVANGCLRYEAKFGNAVETLPWAGRIVVMCNDDPQSLSVLPDLDMSTRDKFMMLMFGDAQYPFSGGPDGFAQNMKWLAEEIPYFARFLLGWEIPWVIRDPRFGVAAYQHASMRQAAAENGLTQVLVDVLELVIERARVSRDPKDDNPYVIVGTGTAIFRWVQNTDPLLARELGDSRLLQQTLMTLYRSGMYTIEYDERSRHWSIPWDFKGSYEVDDFGTVEANLAEAKTST